MSMTDVEKKSGYMIKGRKETRQWKELERRIPQ